MKVHDSAAKPPHLASSKLSAEDKKRTDPAFIDKPAGEIVLGMLNKICPAGSWKLDGDVVESDDESICKKAALEKSPTPVSCACLCNAVSSIHPFIIRIQTHGTDGKKAVADSGEGMTEQPEKANVPTQVVLSGLSGAPPGFGDTAPPSATTKAGGRSKMPQVVRQPAWLILAHELCGHGIPDVPRHIWKDRVYVVKKDDTLSTIAKAFRTTVGAIVALNPKFKDDPHTIFPGQKVLLPKTLRTYYTHEATERGDRSAIDIENLIRAEHSTSKDKLGQRIGTFSAHDKKEVSDVAFSDFNFSSYFGGVYRMAKGETLADVAKKVGIPIKLIKPKFLKETYLRARKLPDTEDNSSVVDKFFKRYPLGSRTSDVELLGDFIRKGEVGRLRRRTLLIEDITYHNVIDGETVASIASAYGIAQDSLVRANDSVSSASTPLAKGMRLLIPAS